MPFLHRNRILETRKSYVMTFFSRQLLNSQMVETLAVMKNTMNAYYV